MAALAALPDDARGAGLLRAVGGLDLTDVPLDAEQTCDVDTVDDLRRARELAARRPREAGTRRTRERP
jgi:CTP:molybdopterin cytidylyltransferase MocA